MSSLASMVAADGPIGFGSTGDDVKAAQLALSAAGYRMQVDGNFGDGTLSAVQRFQAQHGLKADGEIGPITAALLDAPHAVLVQTAAPSIEPVSGFPHDDTASLLAFYGDPANPGWEAANLVPVVPPWPMFGGDTDDGSLPVKAISIHRKCAAALTASLSDIWQAYGQDVTRIHADGLHRFSGSFNYRPIRGSSRLSCHAFAAAIDIDASKYPMNFQNLYPLPKPVYDAFKAHGAFCGQDFHGRQDPMHIQWSHE